MLKADELSKALYNKANNIVKVATVVLTEASQSYTLTGDELNADMISISGNYASCKIYLPDVENRFWLIDNRSTQIVACYVVGTSIGSANVNASSNTWIYTPKSGSAYMVQDSEDSDPIVTENATQTLTKKTLTEPKLIDPIIGSADAANKHVHIATTDQTGASPTVTIPNIGNDADTFLMKDAVQDVTHKTITESTICPTDTAVVSAVKASKVLTVAAPPAEGETVSMGGVAYKCRRSALGAGAYATAVLTSDTVQVTETDTVTIGDGTRSIIYRFMNTMAAVNDVQIGADAPGTMDNLFKAMMGTGTDDVEYFSGTETLASRLTSIVGHLPVATINAPTNTIITITDNALGYAGNTFTKAENSTHLDFDGVGAVFTGGIDPQAANDVFVDSSAENFIINLEKAVELTGTAGTHYGTGTAINDNVICSAKDASTFTAQAKVGGVAGNSIAVAETLSNGASVWDNVGGTRVALQGGVDGSSGTTTEIRVDITNSKGWVCTSGATTASTWKSFSLT
jgi:hypothetical protein